MCVRNRQAYVEFTTTQAATATKHKIESTGAPGQANRKHMVTYTYPQANPFRTLPKDAPMRKDNQARGGGGFNSPMNNNMGFMNNMGGGGGFRGGRGGFNNRGGMNNNNMGYRNFNQPMGGNFQPGPMGGGFQGGQMGGMSNYGGGFNNRGNMMGGGMRGGGMRGRGGGPMGGAPNMMGMPTMGPMGGMGMNPMAGGMNPMMGGMGGNMGMQGTRLSVSCCDAG